MAVYEVKGPDGAIYEVEGPPDATDQQVINAVLQQIRREERQTKKQTFQDELTALRESARTPVTSVEKPPEDKVTVADQFEEFLKGIPGGAAGFAESAALGVTAP